MDNENALIASYYRCRQGDGFFDTFYERFLAKSPAIAERFAQTDFKWQKLMLRQSLLDMLGFYRGLDGTAEEIERLGRRHKELEVQAHMYDMWLDALCESIREHDAKYTPELELLWREAMQKSIDLIIAESEA